MSVVEYIDDKTHRPVFRERDAKFVAPVGAFIRFPSDKVWEVVGHMFDYHMNVPDLWVCVIVKEKQP